jgi:hypothetical protein
MPGSGSGSGSLRFGTVLRQANASLQVPVDSAPDADDGFSFSEASNAWYDAHGWSLAASLSSTNCTPIQAISAPSVLGIRACAQRKSLRFLLLSPAASIPALPGEPSDPVEDWEIRDSDNPQRQVTRTSARLRSKAPAAAPLPTAQPLALEPMAALVCTMSPEQVMQLTHALRGAGVVPERGGYHTTGIRSGKRS